MRLHTTLPAVLFALLVSSFTSAQTPQPPAAAAAQPAAKPPAAAPRTAESAITPLHRNLNREAQFLYRIKEGEVGLLFLGDSITDFWPRTGEFSWLKFAPYNPADSAISGERTEDVLGHIDNGILDGIHPKVVVLMIGTNNTGAKDQPVWTAAGVAKVVQTIQTKLPQTKILLLAVFPRGLKDSTARADNIAVNAIISKLDNGKSIRYLDIGSVFLGPDGEIPGDIMPDKLHPSAKGYDLWYAAMSPLLAQMMK
jgi:lysophospholipase L1-like esterase